jgi:pyroglutamyl-peptidase
VSHLATSLTLECHAHSIGYDRIDIDNKCPDESKIECNMLKTSIDVKELCDIMNKNSEKNGYDACISHNAGRYLCEYIYYQSLFIDSTRVLFVHVPDFDKYPSTQTAKGLYDILSCLINMKCN